MELNDYGSLIAQWKVGLIRSRARRFGFRVDELPDLEQVIVQKLIEAPFDPDASVASERTFVTTIIDRKLINVRRDRERMVRRGDYESKSLDEFAFTEEASSALGRSAPQELQLDVQQAVAGLTPAQKDICQALAEGQTQAEIARRTGRSKSVICEEVKRLRKAFDALGLREYAKK